jgi:hypothetical protein
MDSSQIYILIALFLLAIIASLAIFLRNKPAKLTPLAGLAFGFILAGLFFGERRMVGYGLIGVGVLFAVIDMIKKIKQK